MLENPQNLTLIEIAISFMIQPDTLQEQHQTTHT